MQIKKLSSGVEFTSPEIKNLANANQLVDDNAIRYALRQNPQLQGLLQSKNDTILEIRKISDNQYDIITNSGHIIPIEIVYAPYPYAYRFQSLNWDRGVFNMFCC